MITEKELLEAIRECESEPVTLAKVAKLADFYIVYDHLFGEMPEPIIVESAPYEPPKPAEESTIYTSGESEFLAAIDGKDMDNAFRLLNELVEAVKILHPRMYRAFIEKVCDL